MHDRNGRGAHRRAESAGPGKAQAGSGFASSQCDQTSRLNSRRKREDARKMQQEEMQKEARRRNPAVERSFESRPGERREVRQQGATHSRCSPTSTRTSAPMVASPLPRARVWPRSRSCAARGSSSSTPRLVASEDLERGQGFPRGLFQPAAGRSAGGFLVQPLQCGCKPRTCRADAQIWCHLLIGSYERDAIRPHVLGHFKDLLLATARHPAMLYYLDNWESVAPERFDVGPFAPNRGTVNGVPNSIIPSPLARPGARAQ